jgi:hypothetical protein
VWIGAAFFRLLHPVHAGVASECQILAQALFGERDGIRPGDGDQIEAGRT